MSRQNASRRMFGLIMLAITLLLVACGTDEGDTDPTATSGANSAVPTLPLDNATASVAETEEISEEDLTVVTPDIPATAATAEGTAMADVGTETQAPTDLTGSPVEDSATAATPTSETVATAVSTADAAVESSPAATPPVTADTVTDPVPSTPDSDTAAAPEGETFAVAGDGTGGSGQPGERSSNVPGEATPSASPVAGVSVEGCDVLNVPVFAGATTDYVTVAEVNFRSGPGVDCDQILEDPLVEGLSVTILGGPVVQEVDGSEWLQIEVDGVPGWVSTEFVEPAE